MEQVAAAANADYMHQYLDSRTAFQQHQKRWRAQELAQAQAGPHAVPQQQPAMPFPPFTGAGQGAMDCCVFLGECMTADWIRSLVMVSQPGACQSPLAIVPAVHCPLHVECHDLASLEMQYGGHAYST